VWFEVVRDRADVAGAIEGSECLDSHMSTQMLLAAAGHPMEPLILAASFVASTSTRNTPKRKSTGESGPSTSTEFETAVLALRSAKGPNCPCSRQSPIGCGGRSLTSHPAFMTQKKNRPDYSASS